MRNTPRNEAIVARPARAAIAARAARASRYEGGAFLICLNQNPYHNQHLKKKTSIS
jgi:hypothetical protein